MYKKRSNKMIKKRAPRKYKRVQPKGSVRDADGAGVVPSYGRKFIQGMGNVLSNPAVSNKLVKYGGDALKYFGKITGLGEYHINKNTFIGSDPPIVSNSNCGVRIKHREYIGDIRSSQNFITFLQLNINPGLFASFPWLSGIALNYEQYKFHGLIYEFISTSGSAIASTNNALGEIMMATNYNSAQGVYSNKQQVLNSEYSVSCVPSQNAIHLIECDPKETTVDKLYVRSGVVGANSDIRLYDLGLFQFCCQGQQANSITIGELYCSYDIEFFKPQLIDNTGLTVAGTHYSIANPTNAKPLGGAPFALVKQDFGAFATNILANGQTLTIAANSEPGSYMLIYACYGSSTSLVNPSITASNILLLPNLFNNDTFSNVTTGSITSSVMIIVSTFTIIDPTIGCIITFGNAGTLPSSPTYCDLIITQIPLLMTT